MTKSITIHPEKYSAVNVLMFGTQLITALKPNLYSTDKNHVIMGCNDTQATYLGLPCEQEAVGKYVYDFFEKQVTDIFITNNEEIIRTGVGKTFVEHTACSGTGKIVTSLSHKYPLTNAKGKIIGVMGMSVAVDQSQSVTDDQSNLTAQKNKFISKLAMHKFSSDITKRELDFIPYIMRGNTAKEMAAHFKLSQRTVEDHITSLKNKLRVRSKTELIIKLLQFPLLF